MSIRRLRVLIEHLPPESATKTAIRNSIPDDAMAQVTGEHRPDKAPWSSTELLLATLIDEARMSRGVATAAAGGKPAEFTPMYRPGIPPTSTGARKGMTDEQRRALDPRLRDQPKEA